jgi:hypothetical protein
MSYAGTSPHSTSPRRQVSAGGTITAQIDQFYDWIYQRGVARFAARGTTVQMVYAATQQEGRR